MLASPMLRAQNSTVTIHDPGEYNAYVAATSQSDPRAKAVALENFLQAYPQSVVTGTVLDALIDIYQSLHDDANSLSAASRMLQVDPNNMKAILYSVFLKNAQCGKTSDAQTCDDAAVLASNGLLAPKPGGLSDAEWKKQTSAAYPVFHSAIALDFAISKKDFKSAVAEYTAELMMYTDAQTQSGLALHDTMFLAQAYTKPDAKDLVKAIWFYARVWNFVPSQGKTTIEKALEYYYKQYHGNDLNGLDDIKSQAARTTFPPRTLHIQAALTPAELAHKVVMEVPNLAALNQADKEYILANGNKEDVDKLRVALHEEVTPAPNTTDQAQAAPPAPPQRQYDNLAPPPTPPAPAPTITIGERKAQVLTDFGEPQRKAATGPKEIYFYTDLKMKVTFINGKVSSID
jgi:hypothetical protein